MYLKHIKVKVELEATCQTRGKVILDSSAVHHKVAHRVICLESSVNLIASLYTVKKTPLVGFHIMGLYFKNI